MVSVRTITVTVTVVAIIAAIGYAMHLDDNGEGKGEYFLDWDPGTTMDYQMNGGYTKSDATYDVPYSYDGSTQHDVIVSSTETAFTYERTVTMRVTYTDPVTGETHTGTQTTERSPTQDRLVRFDDYESSQLETKWGTKDVLIIRTVITDDYGNRIDSADYRDEKTFVRLKAELTCDEFRAGTSVLKDWHMTYTLTGYELK